ncbi:hypothetical protein ABEI56_09390 [Peribacillus castrilensis]|uniref:hypothetical protein n=1 Tax=Peribacillus TaxID=2675229 RepID=UPI0038725E59
MRKVRDPAGASRGPTARGKRVPEAEINIQIVQAIKKLQTNTIFIELPTVWVLQHDETPLKMI